jgi:hypothetical protein
MMATSPAKRLLDAGIPLTLLLDLADPAGPDSQAINSVERPPGDLIWVEAVDRRSWRDYILRHAG